MSSSSSSSTNWARITRDNATITDNEKYGRISDDEFILTPKQIETFHKEGCVTIPNVLTEEEVAELELVFDRFMSDEIQVPAKDHCDMSKPFGIPKSEWSIVNCMLPTRYYPPLTRKYLRTIDCKHGHTIVSRLQHDQGLRSAAE